MLFRRRFIHCAMVIPFILLSPSLFFFILQQCVNLTFEGDDSLLQLLLISYVIQMTLLARDIITVAQCFFIT